MQHPKKGIDARLRAAADLVLEALEGVEKPVVADVGCDHGYLTAYLLRQRMDLRVIASDISAASLRKAELLLDPGIYGDRVRFCVADGLDALAGERVDAIVMAGMGGRLILQMLQAGREQIGEAALILQANTDIPLLRATLPELGFRILAERYAEAAGRQYALLLAGAGTQSTPGLRDAFLGMPGAATHVPGRERYLRAMRQKRMGEMQKASLRHSSRGLDRLADIRRETDWIAEELEMKQINVGELVSLIDTLAPFETAEEWDNVGLLLGSAKASVSRVLIALDVTAAVLEEATQLECQAIVSHHPFLFHAARRITDSDREGALMLEMARRGITHIAAHTNLDKAPGGMNDALLAALDLQGRGEGFLRVAVLPEGMTFGQLCERTAQRLQAEIRTYGAPDTPVHALGCCSGAGAEEYRAAMAQGADCFLTGEVRHNVALDALHDGCLVIEAGHFETERPGCEALRASLQKAADELQYNVIFFASDADALERGTMRRA